MGKSGGPAVVVVSKVGSGALAISASSLYFAGGDSYSSLVRVPIVGGVPEVIASPPEQVGITAIALEKDAVVAAIGVRGLEERHDRWLESASALSFALSHLHFLRTLSISAGASVIED